MNYDYLSGNDTADSIMSLLETGLKVGTTIYSEYNQQKISQRNARTAAEVAAAQTRIAELEAEAAKVMQQRESGKLDKTTKYVALGGVGLLGLFTLLSLR